MFVNRKQELEALNDRYASNRAEFLVIYGKRRVGKTELLRQFFQDKPHIFYLADKRTKQDQLREASRLVSGFYGDVSYSFDDWSDLLQFIASKAQDRTLLIIDEFPYLVESDRAIPSLFQKGWDLYLKDSNVFLVLCGSSIGMMERHALAYRSPLYGRRTGQILLRPMRIEHMALFFPDLDMRTLIEFHSILGGIPEYWKHIDPKLSFRQNILANLLSSQKPLYSEIDFVIREELNEPRNYYSILKAVASGKTKINDIVTSTGLDRGLVSKYLSVLRDIHVVRREVPITERNPERSRKGIYVIQENLFRFWFRFILPNRSYIAEGRTDLVMEQDVEPNLEQFVSMDFEDACRDAMWQMDLPVRYQRFGRWWEKDNEIDIVGLNDQTDDILFGECKWRNRKTSVKVAKGLVEKARMVKWGSDSRKEHFVLFSKSGFTNECESYCKKNKIQMFGLKELEGLLMNGKE